MKKGAISNMLRKLGLTQGTDLVRYHIQKVQNRKVNREFRTKNLNVILPPDYLIYESFQLNYKKYYEGGRDTAKWLINHLEKHINLKNKNILDWGCGPGRIIRHLPNLVNNGCKFYGTDYNQKSIKWCSENIENVKFNQNSLEAKLPYADNSIDLIYGISIFTHLSEQLHYDWYNELNRILKPNGIMFLTTQGNNFKIKFTDKELDDFNNGKLIVRGNVKEGHRTFSAFHPSKFMKQLFKNVQILEHITLKDRQPSLAQDIWIIKKLERNL